MEAGTAHSLKSGLSYSALVGVGDELGVVAEPVMAGEPDMAAELDMAAMLATTSMGRGARTGGEAATRAGTARHDNRKDRIVKLVIDVLLYSLFEAVRLFEASKVSRGSVRIACSGFTA